MSSFAKEAFNENAADIERLMAIHEEIGGAEPGRRAGLEVLNKSAVVLTSAIWEAFCEDLAAEALKHLVNHVSSAAELPAKLRTLVAKEVKAQPHEHAVWSLAGDGWKTVVNARMASLATERNTKLNTPKTAQINDLFATAIGLENIGNCWRWAGMTAARAATKLDGIITLRGSIAHRGVPSRRARFKKRSFGIISAM